MSVLINNMDIPKSCSDCPLNYDEMSCVVTGTRWWSDTMVLLNFDYTKERLYDCPISEAPSAQPEPYLDSIVSEIKKTISETKESGKYHCADIRINGEMICFGLQLALEIIEEKRYGQSDKQTGGD